MTSAEIIKELGINAKNAAAKLANVNNNIKNEALNNLKKDLKFFSEEIIKTNKKDIELAHKMKLSSAMIDPLTLNEKRVEGMILSLDEIINLKDPVGIVLSEWTRPNGLHIKKISVPIGVIGIMILGKYTLVKIDILPIKLWVDFTIDVEKYIHGTNAT